VQIAVDDSVIEWLLRRAAEESNSGARPLRRAIQRYMRTSCRIHDPAQDNTPSGSLHHERQRSAAHAAGDRELTQ